MLTPERLLLILEHEAKNHGPEDYKHQVAAMVKAELVHIAALRARVAKLEDALHRIILGSQNSMTTKESLGKEARAALEDK